MQRIIIPLALLFSVCLLSLSEAQDLRAKRRAFVEDLLKGLIESQIEKGQHNYQPQGRPNNNGQPSPPGGPGNNRPPVIVEASREMRDVRRHLASWNQTCGNLIQEIRHHEYESPQLRPLLADALKVKANVELLNRKAQIYPTVQPLVEDFRLIDQDWRMLSYRLKASGGLTNECAQFVNTVTVLDTQLCSLFEIQPQVDRQELMRLATQLTSEYNHLLHDVYYVARGRQGGQQLMDEGRKLQSLMSQATALLQRGNYETIVNAYQRCIGDWKNFSRKLHPYQDERLRRSIADIETTGTLIREQLWIPVSIDREYLASLSNAVARDAGQVFNSVTMAQLLDHPSPGAALNSAREFQTACTSFGQNVLSGAAVEDLEWDYRLFEVQWQDVHHLFHDLKVPRVDHKLEDIETAMRTLGETFGEPLAINHAMMQQITGSLFASSQQLSNDVHRRIVEPRYAHEFHEQICDGADIFARSVNQINQRVAQGRDRNLGRAEFDQLFLQWRNLKQMMESCNVQDKLAFASYRSQIEPSMVKLQVVFAD